MKKRKQYHVVGFRSNRTSDQLGGNKSEFSLMLVRDEDAIDNEKDLVVGDEICYDLTGPSCFVRKIEEDVYTLQLNTEDSGEIIMLEATDPGTKWFTK